MATHHDPQDLIGRTAVDSSGNKIGKVGQVYIDDKTGNPVWVTLSTGLFGNRESFAPLEGSAFSGDDLRLTVTKDQVKDAPTVDNDGKLEKEQQDLLYQHYAAHVGAAATGTGGADNDSDETSAAAQETTEFATSPGSAGAGRTVGNDPAGESTADHSATDHSATDQDLTDRDPTDDRLASDEGVTGTGEPAAAGLPADSAVGAAATAPPAGEHTDSPQTDSSQVGQQVPGQQVADAPGDRADDDLKTITRSEERLHVGKEQYESGLVRLRRSIVTENVTQQIPVSREELHIERVPIDETEQQGADPVELGEHEHEIILHGERAVVTKSTVPVERIRIGTRVVTEQHEVNETLRKEQIDLDGDGIPDYLQNKGDRQQ